MPLSTNRLRLLPVLLPWAAFLYASLAGVDFGLHWDEEEHLQNVAHALAAHTLLPTGGYTLDNDPVLAKGYYAYPSMLFWIGLASASPQVVQHPGSFDQPDTLNFILSNDFRLRYRAICALISSLAIFWVYLAVLRWRKDWLTALVAACLLAGSWEVSYHSRWIATDTIVMQFAALCLLLCVITLDSPNWRRWAYAAAVVAGLATGTKYPAALLIVPAGIAAYFRGGRWRLLLQMFLIEIGTFVLTTPGSILQAPVFFHWLAYQHHHYGYETHWGYTTAGPIDHLAKMLLYESLVFLSPWWPVALLLTAAAIGGVILLRKTDPKLAAIVLVFPILYVGYFATQRVMIVRNLMIVAPFIVFLCAAAVPLAPKRLGPLLLAIAAINIGFTIYAAQTIRAAGNSMNYDLANLRDFMHTHPVTKFLFSAETRDLMNHFDPSIFMMSGVEPAEVDIVVASHDGGDLMQWPANEWDLTLTNFGPLDINFNYYPTWPRNRIVLLKWSRARDVQVDSVQAVIKQRGG